MTFGELLHIISSGGAPRICVDSRLVQAGDIFVATKGTVYDGHDFIDQALANGAKYIVCQGDRRQRTEDSGQRKCEVILVEDSAEAAAVLSQASRGYPASKLINLAVTGTNGKTTVAYLVRSVIEKAGEKCGLVSTVIYDTCSGESCEATLTTPDCLAIAEMTGRMVRAGSRYMVIEASSHALAQRRLAGIDFKAAAFTNLAGDHLDYHKTKEDYLAAKAKLFQGLSPGAVAVLNKQSPEAELIAKETGAKVLWYGIEEEADNVGKKVSNGADISAYIETMDLSGTVFVLAYADGKQKVTTSLLGRHNVSNHLAAAGLCLGAGFDLETIAAGLSSLQTVPGRLEKVECSGCDRRRPGQVFIDYAHSDDALKNVLATLRPLCKGRLIVVFGCGGDRDRTKRPRMARVAEELADCVIVTSDNPRMERPEDIISEIDVGFVRTLESGQAGTSIMIEPDRRKAIELAIRIADEDDIVLIAGKGHETYQIIGDRKFDFSDKKVAENYLNKRAGRVKSGTDRID